MDSSASGFSLALLLWSAAERGGTAPAVVERESDVSWQRLRNRAAAIAGYLAAAGVEPGDRVAILLERGSEAIAALFGAYAAGAGAVVVNDRLRVRQIEHVLRHAGCRALVTTSDMLGRLSRPPESSALTIALDAAPAGEPVAAPAPRESGDLAQIIFTSGSTGLPKGVVFTHGALTSGVAMVRDYLGIVPTDRIAALLPFSSVYGLNQILCAVAGGAALVVERSPLPMQIVASVVQLRVSVLAAVPPLWLQLLEVPGFRQPIASLRQLQNAGGHLPVSAARALRESQPQAELFLQYGLTESFRSTYLPPAETDRRPGSMGRAVPGASIRVEREDGSLCGPDEPGELVHVGGAHASGYWNDPEASARTFRGDAVYSGDIVKRDAEGWLYFVGRRDRMIKTQGFRVGPDEILDVLHASGMIAEAMVDSEPDAERGQRIVAYVVLRSGASLQRLTRFCRTELPPHMVPARYVELAALPRLASGKYDLEALRLPG